MERVSLSSAPEWSFSCLDGLTKSNLCGKNQIFSHGLCSSHLTVRGPRGKLYLSCQTPQFCYKNSTTDESFRFHNQRFDEMRCKLDSTENPRSFEKYPIPPWISPGKAFFRRTWTSILLPDNWVSDISNLCSVAIGFSRNVVNWKERKEN